MARIVATQFDAVFSGYFDVRVWIKNFDHRGQIVPGNWVGAFGAYNPGVPASSAFSGPGECRLWARESEWKGDYPDTPQPNTRVMLDSSGGAIQVLWKLGYDIVAHAGLGSVRPLGVPLFRTPPSGTASGDGTILQIWTFGRQRRPGEVAPLRADEPVTNQHHSHRDMEVVASATQLDTPQGGRYGELTCRLKLQVGASANNSATFNAFPTGVDIPISTSISQGGSASCRVRVRYESA